MAEQKATVYGKEDMVKAISEHLKASEVDVSQKVINAVITAELDIIAGALSQGDKVRYIGHGTYEVRERASRKGRNPQTGDEITIQGGKYPAFKPGKALKQLVK